jgi:hypothetical protein
MLRGGVSRSDCERRELVPRRVNALDLARLKKLAAAYLGATFKELESWCEAGELREVTCEGEEVSEQDR